MKTHVCAYVVGLLALGVSSINAQTTTTTTAAAETEVPSVISECHVHESTQFCMAGTTEYEVHLPTTATVTAVPAEYTDCHSHDNEMFCVDANGEDVEIHLVGTEEEDDHNEDEDETTSESTGENCHFHAGVEHCTTTSSSSSTTCTHSDRTYNIPLRIGFLFIILLTSALGVFGPILLHKLLLPSSSHSSSLASGFTILKQFGTGVIVSTAFVHLYTHATLMFENECLAGLIDYESTSAAILMAGLFLSFCVEYAGQRVIRRQVRKEAIAAAAGAATPTNVPTNTGTGERERQVEEAAAGPRELDPRYLHQRTEMINIMVMEAGIIFHSLLIGLTLVVAGDSFFKTLFVVILFHQMFEGIALGSRIAALGTGVPLSATHDRHHHHPRHGHSTTTGSIHGGEGESKTQRLDQPDDISSSSSSPSVSIHPTVPMRKKILLALAFALVTPVGMAIGIGVLNSFNGNDPATLIAIGTLDALSAGILVWVGVVEMWAEDWMVAGGELSDAPPLTTGLSFAGLVAGMALMSLLGKWA